MEEEVFSDIDGKIISLDCQSHSSFCREFTISAAKVSIGKIMVYTCAVWLFAYTVFFFTEVRFDYRIVLEFHLCIHKYVALRPGEGLERNHPVPLG